MSAKIIVVVVSSCFHPESKELKILRVGEKIEMEAKSAEKLIKAGRVRVVDGGSVNDDKSNDCLEKSDDGNEAEKPDAAEVPVPKKSTVTKKTTK